MNPSENDRTLADRPDPLHGLQVLFVDNDALIVSGIRLAMRREPGWQVRFAIDAETALQALRETPADVVISDLKLSGRSGLDLVREIRRDPQVAQPLCIALSGALGEPDSIEEAHQAGFDDYWTKPISSIALIERIKKKLLDDIGPTYY